MGGRLLGTLCGEFLFGITDELGTTGAAGLGLCWCALFGVSANGLGTRTGLAPLKDVGLGKLPELDVVFSLKTGVGVEDPELML